MEDIKQKDDNARVYVEAGCTFIVKRQFENGGTSILEQIISLLLDIMESKKSELKDKT